MNMRLSAQCGRSNRFEADGIVDNISLRGKLASAGNTSVLISKEHAGFFSGSTYMVREFQSHGLLVERGKDLKCDETKIIVGASALLKAQEENPRVDIFRPDSKILFFIDPERITLTSGGLYALENPKIKVVENAVLEYGGAGKADAETGIAVEFSDCERKTYKKYIRVKNVTGSDLPNRIMHNRFKKGIWGITFGTNVSDGSLDIRVLENVFGSANLEETNYILALLPAE